METEREENDEARHQAMLEFMEDHAELEDIDVKYAPTSRILIGPSASGRQAPDVDALSTPSLPTLKRVAPHGSGGAAEDIPAPQPLTNSPDVSPPRGLSRKGPV